LPRAFAQATAGKHKIRITPLRRPRPGSRSHLTSSTADRARRDWRWTYSSIDETFAFVTRSLSPQYQASLHASLSEATAAGYVQTKRFKEAAAEYGRMVAARPGDARLRLAYGEALLGDGQAGTACAEFEKLRGKELGPRDLGLPPARACLQKGDPAAAVGWLNTIPPQYLPGSIQQDPSFAALRDRADFKALFERR
jgi:predicted Zn-dependent protease